MKPYIEQYSEKSVAVFGDTRYIKEDLKAIGGRYNKFLKSGPGWIFQLSKQPLIEEIIRLNPYEEPDDDEEPEKQEIKPKREVAQAQAPLLKREQTANPAIIEHLERRISDLERQMKAIVEVINMSQLTRQMGKLPTYGVPYG